MEGKPWGMGMPPPSGLGFPGGAADVLLTEEVISKDNTHGFAFTFYFFFSATAAWRQVSGRLLQVSRLS